MLLDVRTNSTFARKSWGYSDVCTPVIGLGLRLLIAAMLCSLLALPAAAHPGHVHDTTVHIVVAAPDTLVKRASSGDVDRGAQVVASAPPTLVFSCCSTQGGCCAGSGCCSGMACGSGSCCHGGSALVLSHAVRVARPAKVAPASRSDRSLAGYAAGPDDRPPRGQAWQAAT